MNYYDILDLPAKATTEAIFKAYGREAVLVHPDKHPGDEDARRRFLLVSEAYAVLADPASRLAYDQDGRVHHRAGQFSLTDAIEVFNHHGRQMIHDVYFAPRPHGRGYDLRCEVEITPEEARNGASRDLKLQLGRAKGEAPAIADAGTTGTVTVTIPPGIQSGTRIVLPGQGDYGDDGHPRGDLVVVVWVKSDGV